LIGLEVRPLTPIIGAEIHGVDLRKPLPEPTLRQIERALLAHMVLFFRDQGITPEQQLAFGRHFGDVYCPPMARQAPDYPDIMLLDQTAPKGEGADNWHLDATFMPRPPLGSILKAVRLPKLGGDTCFANMAAAYEALSPDIQSMLEGLTAVHDLTGQLRNAIDRGISSDDFDALRAQWPPVEHPAIRTHPVTGRKALYLNPNTGSCLKGLTSRENDLLLPFLFEHVRSPEFQCRFRWEPNSIAFWDNRCVQHCGVPDYSERRVMHRVTIEGDEPY
jgi:taurine dioxygenase